MLTLPLRKRVSLLCMQWQRQDFSCMYLAHDQPEIVINMMIVFIIIIIMVIVIIITIIIITINYYCCFHDLIIAINFNIIIIVGIS